MSEIFGGTLWGAFNEYLFVSEPPVTGEPFATYVLNPEAIPEEIRTFCDLHYGEFPVPVLIQGMLSEEGITIVEMMLYRDVMSGIGGFGLLAGALTGGLIGLLIGGVAAGGICLLTRPNSSGKTARY